MHNPFRSFFYFSRGERRGILVLMAVIILIFLTGLLYPYLRQESLSPEEKRKQAASVAEYEAFLASIEEKEPQRKQRSTPYPAKYIPPPTPVSFNPNTADSALFCRLGLPAWMVRNILNYRRKGGKFRKKADFSKIYGLTEEQYQTLLPYIRIAPEDTVRSTRPSLISVDSTAFLKNIQYKYPAGTIVELNLADTTELKKIPGIGSHIARLITGYRQRLGGFYRIEQLQDIHLDYHLLESWFHVDPQKIHPMNLNRSGIEKLRSHPYINFYQAKAFVEYRKKNGTLRNLKPFALYEEFSETDLERISHYVCFE
ncbi:helix-hairpin-helix domain-containing protein [Bacteroides zoogleoformans]|uniref:helix-hairpin-helix domain-containing protein n=1 Tax=Bacteroides zoogleoformans TaxID=28119 RepID=UPI00248D94C0|nr:helix-hairpin-helix domain-containing protein [Bacteroides zoogleoformans]